MMIKKNKTKIEVIDPAKEDAKVVETPDTVEETISEVTPEATENKVEGVNTNEEVKENISLEEQTKAAEEQEKNEAELEDMRTKKGAERALQRMIDEEGFDYDADVEARAAALKLEREQETVGQDVKRRFKEYKESWENPIQRKIHAKKFGRFCSVFFRTFILIGLCFVILTPIIEKISYALRAPQDITNQQVVWIPENWSFMNIHIAFSYLTLMKDNSYKNIAFLYNISTFFNSFVLSLITAFLQVIATAVAGYSFARLKFKGNNILFYLVILTLIFPAESLETARSLFFNEWPFFGINLISNSFAIYIMSAFGMGLRSAIFIYLFRQFFRGVPIELEESAEIDGAGIIRTFWSVMLPNARGAIVTVSLFAFVWQYNDLYWATLFKYQDPNVMPLLTTSLASSANTFNSLIATNFQSLVSELGEGIAHNSNFYGLILNTSALLMMLPLIIGYLFVQRLFVESIERTGITGM